MELPINSTLVTMLIYSMLVNLVPLWKQLHIMVLTDTPTSLHNIQVTISYYHFYGHSLLHK
jgi:hypothetical protein